MKLKIKTDVTTEPINYAFVQQVVNDLGTLTADEQTKINSMISAARELCEQYVGRSFAEKTLQLFITAEEVEDNNNYIELPGYPISLITSVTPYDKTGTAQDALVAGTSYYVEGQLGMDLDIRIPTTISTVGDEITVTDYLIEYVAGYGASNCETIPDLFKITMAKMVGQWMKNKDNWIAVLAQEFKMNLNPFVKTIF